MFMERKRAKISQRLIYVILNIAGSKKDLKNKDLVEIISVTFAYEVKVNTC